MALIALVVVAFGIGATSASAAWTAASAGAPAGTEESRLYGVSCTGEICWAVGDYRPSPGVLEPFAYQTLSNTYALPPTPSKTAELTDISCAASNFCMAVGQFINKSGNSEAFAEKWTVLSGWVLQALTFPAGTYWSEIFSVSCPTESECMAVGDYHDSTGMHYLAEHWKSGSWEWETPVEPPGSGYLGLTAISCPAKEKCVAVGAYRVPPYTTVIQKMETESFEAGSWTYQGSASSSQMSFAPSPGTVPFIGTDSCISTTKCSAVGYYTNSSSAFEMMAWEKSATTSGWEPQALPALVGEKILHGVYCWASTKCYAVGRYKPTGGSWTVLAEELSGPTWTRIILPTVTGASESYLSRDACFEEKRFCSLVGWSVVSGVTSALVERNF
jgi:hypothetical protein